MFTWELSKIYVYSIYAFTPPPLWAPGHIQPIQHCNLSSNFLKGNLLLRVIKNGRLKIADTEKNGVGLLFTFYITKMDVRLIGEKNLSYSKYVMKLDTKSQS